MSPPERNPPQRAKGSSYRDFPGRRWLVVFLRAGHMAGVVGVGAGTLAPVPAAGGFVGLMVLSGVLMMALDVWSNPSWLAEWAGLSVVFKLVLLAVLALDEAHRPALFWLILIFSVVFAHAPARFRHRRWSEKASAKL